MPAVIEHGLVVGAVYRIERASGLSPLGVYTGQMTPSGRCRFEVVDRRIGETFHFSCKAETVIEQVAESLAAWCRMREEGAR